MVLCLLWWAKSRQKRDRIGLALNLWAILAALLCAVRAVAKSSSDERCVFTPALVLAAAWAFRKGRGTAREPLFWLGFLPGIAAYAFILRSTLLGFSATFMHPDLARALRLLCHAGTQGGGSRSRENCPRASVCGGAAGILLVCRLVRSGNGLEACQCGNSQPEADHHRPRPPQGPGRHEAADMQMALYEALEPFAGKQVLQAISSTALAL